MGLKIDKSIGKINKGQIVMTKEPAKSVHQVCRTKSILEQKVLLS